MQSCTSTVGREAVSDRRNQPLEVDVGLVIASISPLRVDSFILLSRIDGNIEIKNEVTVIDKIRGHYYRDIIVHSINDPFHMQYPSRRYYQTIPYIPYLQRNLLITRLG